MEKLKAKLKKQGGFTLIEMLIVVAIIAILIAVSIPLIGTALEKARDATDQANERAAKAEATLILMEIADFPTGATVADEAATVFYNAETGAFEGTNTTNIEAYGRCKGTGDCYTSVATPTVESHEDMILSARIDRAAGTITLDWVAAAT